MGRWHALNVQQFAWDREEIVMGSSRCNAMTQICAINIGS